MDALLQSARELLGTMSPAQLAAINAGPQSMPARPPGMETPPRPPPSRAMNSTSVAGS
ncbi:hypothetical protein I552_0651 [Mycobacterium xenopi 3993]|nr:hypothetical protein I552_0651 [Mycobacterium xenopi 3993]